MKTIALFIMILMNLILFIICVAKFWAAQYEMGMICLCGVSLNIASIELGNMLEIRINPSYNTD